MKELNAMHLVEDLFFLALDLYALGLADAGKALTELIEGNVTMIDINNHHHGEELLKDGLVDVEDVDMVLSQVSADGGDDTHGIFAYNGNDGTVHI